MANLFDRDNYPTQEPDLLVVGDRWMWRRPDLVADYPTADYALTYEFHDDAGGGGSHKFTITATETTTDYIVEIASATTASYTAGEYNWYAFITRSSDSQRIAIDEGHTKIELNFANTNADNRSHAKKVLDAIQAVLENRASQDQMSYSIAGRSLSRMTIDDLMRFRDRYRAEYNREIKLKRIKNKQDTGNTIKARF
jgi:hypothetical protein|tara:strand:+ start:1407 stop:1997 length:591 start_codon:yes stop_codon:yes gene_type:complete